MKQEYIDLYKQEHEKIKKHSSDALNHYRDESFRLFEELGFPTTALENYKYTDLTNSLSHEYGLNLYRLKSPINPYEAFRCNVPGIHSHLYFVVNDSFYTSKEQATEQLPKGVIIGSLRKIASKQPELLAPYFGKLTQSKNDGLIAFNGTFAQDGFFMYVPKDVEIEQPIQLINVMNSKVNLMANSHNLIILEEGAKAKLLVCDHAMSDVQLFANRVTEVFVGKNAAYEHYKLESTHKKMTNLDALFIDQQESSDVLTNVMTLRNGLTRNNIDIEVNGEECETLLCGISIGGKEQEIDNFTSLSHNKPNCHSTELFKCVLDDEAKGGFTGRILVAQDAQKTLAYQNSKNILLSKKARMRTKPQLEIYADDVKCSHGATIGQLDETAKFYLQARGIPEAEARMLLMSAFAQDVIDNIRIEPLRDRMKMMIENRLRSGVSKAEGCSICS